jgi:hypothetical protein
MGQLIKYPRGYLNRATPFNTGVVESDTVSHEIVDAPCNSSIEMLYNLYTARAANASKWGFRRMVIYHCAQVFGDFRDWLTLNVVRNDNIYGLNIAFIEDTVQYIRTGRRDQRVQTWKEILQEYPDRHVGVANRKRLELFQLADSMEFDNFIGDWCSHPGGLEDMLWTAHVLFGSAKVPLRNHPLF